MVVGSKRESTRAYRRHFEQRVRERKQRDGDGIAVGRHFRLLQQIIASLGVEDLRVSNVASVEEVEQVHPAAEGQDAHVQTPVEVAVAFLVFYLRHRRGGHDIRT